MINYESRYLSWLGIPPGIVLGAIVGTVLGSNEFSSGFSPINIPFVMKKREEIHLNICILRIYEGEIYVTIFCLLE